MAVDVLGMDHVYLTVGDLSRSEGFYDRLLVGVLGFRKKRSNVGGDPHVHYYCRHYGISLRPSRTARAHDPYSPGLHHFCFRVEGEADVDTAFEGLTAAGIEATPPQAYPDYAPDYRATFFADPDGIRLEITNFRAERRLRMERWEELENG
jgi:catechol 2,3-dioxygenase-like lactoylglutathione lyase family enzyme